MNTDPEFWQSTFFNPDDAFDIVAREHLPHWSQAGVLTFITWRTRDSIPRAATERLAADRYRWLRDHSINANSNNWQSSVQLLSPKLQAEFQRRFGGRWQQLLDECSGECVLRRPELHSVVADSLKHYDRQKYVLSEFVVMPNHVHVIASFPTPEAMLQQVESWKHFTAVRINRILGRSGRFWDIDGFDHLIRNERQFEYLRMYIAGNPEAAGTPAGEYVHYSSMGRIVETRIVSEGHSRSECPTLLRTQTDSSQRGRY